MMSVFRHYARYYDLLYRDKDYAAEARYVADLLSRYGHPVESLLDLGCGTGLHAVELARLGYRVHGVDLSTAMLERAEQRRAALPPEIQARLSFAPGDLRGYRNDRSFDAVTALFHVISYQSTNRDLAAAFATAAACLRPGGVFLFDVWYGPAVLTDPPAVRVKRMQDDVIEVIRIADPIVFANLSLVDVNYTILIKDNATGKVEEMRETHRMRYLFCPELELMLGHSGLSILHSATWLLSAPPALTTWSVCFVASKSPS